ncbi:MAG: hypothetical protein DI628_04230 [Blastochloris viridis]|uniref:Lipoprotein n=1 Tax=Blastochloris viridis TaxID=1079 RepID=A0A6N4RFI3_BLAVI|nr:MAG: hypothetical protein DI628_04230 [Blastochloris viridis]
MKRLVLLALVLAACGPTYRTNYTLNEPATESGRLCSSNVIVMSNTCVENCRQMARSCYNPGGFHTSIGYGRGGYGGWGYNQSLLDERDCSPRQCEENCLASARAAHVRCGGTVTEETVCTANCDKAPR